MKITDKGHIDATISQVVKNDRAAAPEQAGEGKRADRSGEPTKVTISQEARKLQRVAELAKKGDELRAEKVNTIKEQVEKGEYKVEPEEVAKSIVRNEAARLLSQK